MMTVSGVSEALRGHKQPVQSTGVPQPRPHDTRVHTQGAGGHGRWHSAPSPRSSGEQVMREAVTGEALGAAAGEHLS